MHYSPLGCFKIIYGKYIYHVSNVCVGHFSEPIPYKLLFICTPKEYDPSDYYGKYCEDVPEDVRQIAEMNLEDGLAPWIDDIEVLIC